MLLAVEDLFAMATAYLALGDIKLSLGDTETGLAMGAAGVHLNKRPIINFKSDSGSIRSHCRFNNPLLLCLTSSAGEAHPVFLLVDQLNIKGGLILLHNRFRLLCENTGKYDVACRFDQFAEAVGKALQRAGKNIGQ